MRYEFQASKIFSDDEKTEITLKAQKMGYDCNFTEYTETTVITFTEESNK